MKKYFWTTKDGDKIDIDDMSIEHLRNAFKMVLRHNANSKRKPMGNIERQFQEAEWQDWENQQMEYQEHF